MPKLTADIDTDEPAILRVLFASAEFVNEDDIGAVCLFLGALLRKLFIPVEEEKVHQEDDRQVDVTREEENVGHPCAMLLVRDIHFTHDTVAPCFRDGRTFEDFMSDHRVGTLNPMINLKSLKVYHWPGRGSYSRDNRRLKCLKKYSARSLGI